MLKLIVRVLIFSFVSLLLINWIDPFFVEKDKVALSYDNYRHLEKNVEVGIFGSSHAFNAYDPRVFETELGLTTYNFGGTAQRFKVAIPLIREIIKENDLKLAIVDIFNMSIDTLIKTENSRGYQFATLDNTEISWSKVKAYVDIFGYENIQELSPAIRNHAKWEEVFDKYTLRDKEDFYNGFITERVAFSQRTWKRFLKKVKNKREKDVIENLGPGEKKLIDRVVSLFDEHGIPVVFVSSPSYFYKKDANYKRYQLLIAKYLKSTGVPFVDYNTLWDSLNLRKENFKDPNHLNLKGSVKVSQHLVNHVKTYIHNTERNNPVFSNNRYYLIDNNFKEAIFYKKNLNEKVRMELGLQTAVLYRVLDNRYEILLQQSSNKNLHIKLEYKVEKHILETLPDEFKKNQKRKKLKFYDLLRSEESLTYKDKLYKIYQFNCPAGEIKNLKVFVGPKRNLEIINVNKLK